MNNKITKPPTDEMVCYNCKYMKWMVGIGQGVRCKHPQSEPDADGWYMKIHSRWHSCELFEVKEKPIEEHI